MSVKVSAWVWQHSRAQGAALLTLLAIADSAEDDGTNAWPRVSALAAKVRMSSRTVQRHIRALATLGELRVEPRAGGPPTMPRDVRPNRYSVVMTGVRTSPGDNLTGGPGDTGDTGPGDTRVANPVTLVTPQETSRETSLETSSLSAPAAPGVRASTSPALEAPEATPLGRAVLEACGVDPKRLTEAARRRHRKAIRDLGAAGAQAADVAPEAEALRRKWSKGQVTPQSLAAHWGEALEALELEGGSARPGRADDELRAFAAREQARCDPAEPSGRVRSA